MKKLIGIVLVVVLVAGAAFVLVHKCDECEKIIFGSGYYNVTDDEETLMKDVFDDGEISSDSADKDSIICEDCINEMKDDLKEGALGIVELDVEDLKRPLF